MLKFKDNKFTSLPETDLKTNKLLERANLQEAIAKSWPIFRKEIGIPDLLFIGQEVVADEKRGSRIDILAFDPNPDENVPVVIELKRGNNKLQLLQAASYAAMISSWDSEKFIQEAKKQNSLDLEEVESILSNLNLDENIKIILISEKFDPEVIVTADWFYRQFGMDISAVSINIFKKEEDLYFSFEQKYPLAELHDSYEHRRKQRTIKSETNWEKVAETFSYEWMKELLDKCRKEKEGDPGYRRIVSFRSNFHGFKRVSLSFREKSVYVRLVGMPGNVDELIQSNFREKIELRPCKDAYSFNVFTQSQYEDLCSWLEIK